MRRSSFSSSLSRQALGERITSRARGSAAASESSARRPRSGSQSRLLLGIVIAAMSFVPSASAVVDLLEDKNGDFRGAVCASPPFSHPDPVGWTGASWFNDDGDYPNPCMESVLGEQLSSHGVSVVSDTSGPVGLEQYPAARIVWDSSGDNGMTMTGQNGITGVAGDLFYLDFYVKCPVGAGLAVHLYSGQGTSLGFGGTGGACTGDWKYVVGSVPSVVTRNYAHVRFSEGSGTNVDGQVYLIKWVRLFKNPPGGLLPPRQVAPSQPPEQTWGTCDGVGTHALAPSACTADPVNSLTGAFTTSETDLTLPGIGIPFELSRSYTSADPLVGRLGPGWTDSYASSLSIQPGGNVILHGDEGQRLVYTTQADGSFRGAAGARSILTAVAGGYQLVRQDQVTYRFDSIGLLLSTRDRNGQGLTFAYDGTGKLTGITDSGGRAITLAYNTDGLLGSVSVPDGRTVSYGYAGGRLTSVTLPDPDGPGPLAAPVTSYTYDMGGRLATVKDANNHTQVTNVYDASTGRVSQQTDANGKVTSFAWDPSTQTASATDARLNVWKDVYASNVLIKRIDATSKVTALDHDLDLNATAVTAPDTTSTTTMEYDTRGNLLKATAPVSLGSVQKIFTYDAQNNVTSVKDGRLKITSYGYDAAGNNTSIVQDGVTVAQYAYNTAGQLTSSTDGNNKTTTYTYDAYGNLASATDPLGSKTTYTYDGGGRLLTQVDPLGNVAGGIPAEHTTSYTYDADGRLLTETDQLGRSTTHTYDAAGNETSITDANLHATTSVYDDVNRLIRVTGPDPDGSGPLTPPITTYIYDAVGNRITEVDPRGNLAGANAADFTTSYSYDADNRLVSVTTPKGETTSYGYDANGNRIKTVDPRGNVQGANPDDYATTFAYDVAGRLLRKTDPLGNTTAYTYDAVGNQIAEVDPRGNVAGANPADYTTTYGYDGLNRLISVSAPDGGVARYSYDNAGNKLSETDPRNDTTSYAYDDANRLVSTRQPDPDGAGLQTPPLTTYGYDANGNQVSKVEPRGNVAGCGCASQYTWTYAYDRTNRRTSESDPLGHATSWSYDPVGNKLTQKDANDHTTSSAYDGVDRLLTVTAPDTGVTTYAYDVAGNLLTRKDAENHTTTYSYDADNRRTTVTTPGGELWTTAYDPAGNLSSTTDAKGNATLTAGDGTTSYGYDRAGRLSGIDYSDATPDVSFSYDSAGNRISMTDGQGTQTRTYDSLNRLTGVTRGTDTFSYSYDLASNVTSRTYPDTTVTTYTYDAADRLASAASAGATTSYDYDPAGNLTQTMLPTGNGYVETRSYDRAGRLTEVKNANGANVLSDFASTLDPVGNPTQIARTGTLTETRSYGYDPNDRLTSVCFQAGSCPGVSDPFIRWSYDKVGNRLTEDRPAGTTTYSYNPDDELTQTSAPPTALSYPQQAQADGAEPYWRLGETSGTSFASSVGTYPGTWSGSPTLGATGALNGDANKAVTLNGSSQYGTVADSNQLDKTSGFSLELWVKRTKDKQTQAIVGKPLTTTTANENYALWFDKTNKLSFEVGAGAGTNKSAKLASAVALDTSWHYVVATFASGALKLYVDGALSASMTATGFTSAGVNTSTLDLGRAGTASYYGGSLDEFAIYGTALSASQISTHYSKGTIPPPGPTITGYQYDANGNQTKRGTLPYTYDLANRLTSVGNPPSPPPPPPPTGPDCVSCPFPDYHTYSYDGDGNRLSASDNTVGEPVVTNYLWDVNGPLPQLALERDDAGFLLRRYTYGAGRISMSSGGSSFYYHYDMLGAVSNLTSGTGASEWTYSYEPFGSSRSSTKNDPNAPLNPMQFTGEYLDSTGLYYLRARQYAPAVGKFVQVDPVPTAPGEPYASAYAYAGDRPTVLTDPSGRTLRPAREGAERASAATSPADTPPPASPNDPAPSHLGCFSVAGGSLYCAVSKFAGAGWDSRISWVRKQRPYAGDWLNAIAGALLYFKDSEIFATSRHVLVADAYSLFAIEAGLKDSLRYPQGIPVPSGGHNPKALWSVFFGYKFRSPNPDQLKVRVLKGLWAAAEQSGVDWGVRKSAHIPFRSSCERRLFRHFYGVTNRYRNALSTGGSIYLPLYGLWDPDPRYDRDALHYGGLAEEERYTGLFC